MCYLIWQCIIVQLNFKTVGSVKRSNRLIFSLNLLKFTQLTVLKSIFMHKHSMKFAVELIELFKMINVLFLMLHTKYLSRTNQLYTIIYFGYCYCAMEMDFRISYGFQLLYAHYQFFYVARIAFSVIN